MIIGLGTDIVEIARIEKLYHRFGTRFLQRLFTENEQAYCAEKTHAALARYAKRFAAKEACLKALGTGRSHSIKWRDIDVTRTNLGQPTLSLSGKCLDIALKRLEPGYSLKAHVSLSDTKDLAQATVILEGVKENG
tara:strand:- start:3735 stop:4142 length:408 start_codon:yes stop_codon:yes gene_type:complete